MLFCEVSWYGSGLPNIFHINKKVTKPPLQPLPLYYPVLHLSLCWLLVVNFSTSTAAIAYVAQCPKKHCLPLSSSTSTLLCIVQLFVWGFALLCAPTTLILCAHMMFSAHSLRTHHAHSPLSPFEDSRTDNGHHGLPNYPILLI